MRRDGPPRQKTLRQVRRLSNWTAAALILGTGSATWALAQQFPGSAQTAATTSWTTTGTAVAAQGTVPNVSGPVAVSSGSGAIAAAGAQAPAATAPQVSRPVAVSSGSGVTVRTTRVVNGQTITTVQHIGKRDD